MFGFGIKRILAHIFLNQEKIMATLDEVKASIAALGTSVSAEIQAVSDKLGQLQNAGGASAQDLGDLKTSIDAIKTTVDNETAALSQPSTP